MRKYVIVLLDGAPDLVTNNGLTPLETAHIPYMDRIADDGVTGLMNTMYPDLPRGSLVAQLGILGWDPHKYYPFGRASSEALSAGLEIGPNDVTFRTNLVLMNGPVLVSHSANHVTGPVARNLVNRINGSLGSRFPGFELSNVHDFRNVLIVRNADVEANYLDCPEPHEHIGDALDISGFVKARTDEAVDFARLVNRYAIEVQKLIESEPANAALIWSPSGPFVLPGFDEINGFKGKSAVVGHMDFLIGMAIAGGMEFFREGNGCIDTDYRAKGRRVIQLLKEGYNFVYCHINAPDEAAHNGDFRLKTEVIENIDRDIVGPLFEYFKGSPDELGGLMVTSDHYTNSFPHDSESIIARRESHGAGPVLFAVWNGNDRDRVTRFNEKSVAGGRYSLKAISHLDLLKVLFGKDSST